MFERSFSVRLAALAGAALLTCGTLGCAVSSNEGDVDLESAALESGAQGPGESVPEEDLAGAPDLAASFELIAGLPAKKVLSIQWQGQPNGYWCGPGSTRMALSARMGSPPSQSQLASYMGTTTNGTNHIGLPAKALNNWLRPGTPYKARNIDWTATPAQREQLKRDVVARVGTGWPIVANVISGWRPPGYPSGTIYHYVAIVGYDQSGNKVLIADPAGAGSAGPSWRNVPKTYWVSIQDLGTWIGGKGYTA